LIQGRRNGNLRIKNPVRKISGMEGISNSILKVRRKIKIPGRFFKRRGFFKKVGGETFNLYAQ
jgi:hypothetical protein